MSQLANDEERQAAGDRLAKVRQQVGFSQSEMSNALKVGLRTYQAYEQGLREIPSTIYRRLMQQFHVDPAWLLEGGAERPSPRRDVQDKELWAKAFWAVHQALTESSLEISMEKRWKIVEAVYAEALRSGQLNQESLSLLLSIAA